MNMPLLICKIHFFEIESNNSTLKCTFLTVIYSTTWNISASFFQLRTKLDIKADKGDLDFFQCYGLTKIQKPYTL